MTFIFGLLIGLLTGILVSGLSMYRIGNLLEEYIEMKCQGLDPDKITVTELDELLENNFKYSNLFGDKS
tara:strand:- start:910 stop:1116 length:207 start_codon:yes stop_codon:yes gene_type:complete